jgi:hypothetical protein
VSVLDLERAETVYRDLEAVAAGRAGSLANAVLVGQLQEESATEFSASSAHEATADELGADGNAFRRTWRFAGAESGPALRSVHESPEAIAFGSELTGREMAPATASYLSFRDGDDFIGSDTDVPACEVVLLLGITSETAELALCPHFEHAESVELRGLSGRSQVAADRGRQLPVKAGVITALVGRGVPHQTVQASRTETDVQASLCCSGRSRAS